MLDFETRCEESVTELGAWKYSRHPSNEVLCVSWAVRTASGMEGPARTAVLYGGPEGRAAVERRVRDAGFVAATRRDFIDSALSCGVWVAHNNGFERAHIARHFQELARVSVHWSCTAARARAIGLPGSLNMACKVMRTPNQKSEEGHRIMLQVAQPRPTWNKDPSRPKWYEDADRLAATAIYCARDILAECDLDAVLPELSERERAVWLQVERANERGLRLDADLIDAMEHLVDVTTDATLTRIRNLTGDQKFSLTAPASVRAFCASRGLYLDDLTAGTIKGALARHESGSRRLDPVVAEVLEGRQIVGKSSNAKLPAMRDRMESDWYARDYAIYHGAHTGRQTGAKVNPLNLPKPWQGYDPEAIVPLVKTRDRTAVEAATGRSASAVVSATLRGVIIPPEGKKFAIADYASIEPCVLFALAGQWDAVQVLDARKSIYCEVGPTIYGRPVEKGNGTGSDYKLCKAVVLGCGYGLGLDNFTLKVESEGIDADKAMIERAWRGYRARFAQVPKLWTGVQEAAKAAIKHPHHEASYSAVKFVYDGAWLTMILPSGRPVYYVNARLAPGKFSDEIVYEGRRRDGTWGDVRTYGAALVENICQSVSRDITMEDKLDLESMFGWRIPLDVYDEIVAEVDIGEADAVHRMESVMSRRRAWAPYIPIRAEGFEAMRYGKEA